MKKWLVFLYGKIVYAFNKLSIGLYHLGRSCRFANDNRTRNGWKASMRVRCHILEKGLTMPNTRFGFGQSRILDLLDVLNNSSRYETEDEYQYAIGLLKEYLDFHDRNEKTLPPSFRAAIEEMTGRYPDIEPERQIDMTSGEYFSHADAPFPEINQSRRTVRHFAAPAPYEDVVEAIKLAGYAPSACNRQSVRCHYFEGEMVQKILAVQTGNNGFGHLAPQLIVLTSDASMVGSKEYNDSFTNAGIFAMNLSYAFYFKQIASCILNWSVLPRDDRELRRIANIPREETVVLIMALGKVPDNFRIAVSKRQPVEEYLIKH